VSAEQNQARIRKMIVAINAGKLDEADALMASDYIYRSPGMPEMRGPEGFKQLVSMFRTAFPDLNMVIDDMLADGDKVAFRWTGTGTHQGDLMGIPPTGKRVTTTGLVISRFAGDKVVEDYEIIDTLGMMQQLGVVPAPEQAQA
jgi:steroid delta-isomerase-like uncharacterized protein